MKVEGPGGRWRPGLWALCPALQSKGSAGVRTMLRCCRPSWKDTDVPSWWWFRNNKIVWFWKIISQDVMECFDNRLIERAENCICSGRWASLGQGVSCARHPPPPMPVHRRVRREPCAASGWWVADAADWSRQGCTAQVFSGQATFITFYCIDRFG